MRKGKFVGSWKAWLGFLILIPSLLLNHYLWQKVTRSESKSLAINENKALLLGKSK